MSIKIESASSPESADLIRDFLRSHRSGVLATADSAANPHTAVIYYVLEEDFSLLFATKTETQKFKNIEENEQVAFAVYDEKSQTALQIGGHATVVDDDESRKKVLNNMFKTSVEESFEELPPAEKLYAGGYVAVRLVPTVTKLAVFARPDSQGDDLYETLLFSAGR